MWRRLLETLSETNLWAFACYTLWETSRIHNTERNNPTLLLSGSVCGGGGSLMLGCEFSVYSMCDGEASFRCEHDSQLVSLHNLATLEHGRKLPVLYSPSIIFGLAERDLDNSLFGSGSAFKTMPIHNTTYYVGTLLICCSFYLN